MLLYLPAFLGSMLRCMLTVCVLCLEEDYVWAITDGVPMGSKLLLSISP